MSNHDGSYMLNDVLIMLHEKGIFKKLSKLEVLEVINEVVSIGDKYDCNYGEILEDIEVKLRIKLEE